MRISKQISITVGSGLVVTLCHLVDSSKTTLGGCFYNPEQPESPGEDNAGGRGAYDKQQHKEMTHHGQQAAMRKISTSRF